MRTGDLYTSSRFPFAAIFERLTEYTGTHNVSPLELYMLYQRERRRARLTPCPDYASTSITSGGHAYVPGLSMAQVIAANTRTARQMVDLMESQGVLDRESIVLPVDLGHVSGWQQSDYIHFWLLVISGLDLWTRPQNSRMKSYEMHLGQALTRHQVDLAAMNNLALSAVERAPQYFRFADACVEAARLSKTDHQATFARKIVSLVDPKVSLGGQTERYFARTLGIPVYLPRAVQPAGTLREVVTARQLIRDIETIISFGGTVCEVAKYPALVCIRDEQLTRVDAPS